MHVAWRVGRNWWAVGAGGRSRALRWRYEAFGSQQMLSDLLASNVNVSAPVEVVAGTGRACMVRSWRSSYLVGRSLYFYTIENSPIQTI